jgi:hypothetical protein
MERVAVERPRLRRGLSPKMGMSDSMYVIDTAKDLSVPYTDESVDETLFLNGHYTEK